MAEPTYIPDHYERGLARLPIEFRHIASIQAFVKTWAEPLQQLEDDMHDVKTRKEYFNAKGASIDRYGRWVGLERFSGEIDGAYKQRIATEIVSRASTATDDGLRKVIEAVLGVVDTNIVDMTNSVVWEANNEAFQRGGVFLWGFANVGDDRILYGGEALMVRRGVPPGTKSVVYGMHKHTVVGENNLFIPCEILAEPFLLSGDAGEAGAAEVLHEQEIVDQVGVHIGAGQGLTSQYAPGWEQGIAAEFSDYARDELEMTNTDLTDDTLDVKTGTQGVEAINVLTTGIETRYGVALEILADNR